MGKRREQRALPELHLDASTKVVVRRRPADLSDALDSDGKLS
jgi:hypothetical protein